VDDELQSNTVAGRLAYTVPSVSDVIGAPLDAISNHYIANNDVSLKFEVSV